jgi:anti-sigma factor RsiW
MCLIDKTMPMTEKIKTSASGAISAQSPEVLQDERTAAMVSAYLDGELEGDELLSFEVLLRDNEALSREVVEMRRINRQLTELGADILSEPIPNALLEALSRLQRE